MTILTIASTTILETARRRVVAIVGVSSIFAIIGIWWGFARLAAAIAQPVPVAAVAAVLTILLAFAFSVLLAVGGSFLAAPAIAGELENGTALAILPRPISRASYVLGKWVGLASLVAVYAAACGALAFGAIALGAGYRAPHETRAIVFLVAESVTLFTAALALSTRLGPIATGIVSVSLFGFAWIAGITAVVARDLKADMLADAATAAGLLVPTDGLWRGAAYDLTPIAMLVALEQTGPRSVNPFGVSAPPAPAFLVWSGLWVVAVLGLAIASLRTRDI